MLNHELHEFHEPQEVGFVRFVKFVVSVSMWTTTRSVQAISTFIKLSKATPWPEQT